MKKILFLFIPIFLGIFCANAQNIFPTTGSAGIGTLSPNASAILDVVSTNKGILIPRMTIAQRNLIATPATGLMIYQTNSTPGFYFFNGVAWAQISTGKANSNLNNLSVTTAINASLVPATTGLIDLGSGNKAWRNAYFTGNVGIGTYNPTAKLEVTGDALINTITVGRGGGNDITNNAVGYQALQYNVGNNNTAIGSQALLSNTNGALNTATGGSSLYSNTNGFSNTANGTYSLYSNSTGNNNTATGQGSLYANTFGNDNTATGKFALASNTSGNANTANGVEALYYNTGGINNTANGNRALYTNGSGNYNTATGNEALKSNTSGDNNTANGSFSLYANTTGINNTATGLSALSSNISGSGNTASGTDALRLNNYGSNNTAHGKGALYSNTTGTLNTATGNEALYFNNDGNYNTANGMNALRSNANGSSNTGIGINALYTTNGNDNTAVGRDAIYYVSGNQNTGLGRNALIGLTTGDNNIGIGYGAQVPISTGSNQIRIGNSAITYAGVQIAWSLTSDKRLKSNIQKSNLGLAFIQELNPVSYVRKNDKSNKTEYGFIAQELETTLNNSGAENSGIITKDDAGMYSVRYNDLLAPMVKSIQELSTFNGQLKIDNKQLKAQAADQEKRIAKLESLLMNNSRSSASINQQSVGFSEASLEQNAPNPPAGNFTKINYNIPNGAEKAEVVIVDNAGRKIKIISLNTFGKGVLNVDTKGLTAGTYTYTMYVDGKMVDTKKMVLAK